MAESPHPTINTMKKVLYVITKSNWGGAQKYVFDLATSLPKDQFEVVVAYGPAPNGEEGLLARRLNHARIRGIYMPELSRDISGAGDFQALRSLFRLYKKEKPDIVHLNSSKAAGLGAFAARLARIRRIIFTVHGWPFLEERAQYQKALIELFSWMTTLLSHHTITLSDLDCAHAKNWPLVHKKIYRIYNGVTKVHDTPRTRTELRTALSPSLGEYTGPLLLTIAELHTNKGLMHMLRALTNVPDVRWVIVGEGEEREALEKYARSVGLDRRVHFVGFIENAAELISGGDIFVLPSTKEGFPFVLLEAGARQVPIITTRVGGIPELINEKTGVLVPAKDPVLLAHAITATLKHPEEAHARAHALFERIEKEFNFESVTLGKTVALYVLK